MPEIQNPDMSLEEFEFKEMLNLVDEKYRVILILYYVEGFQIADIAGILKLNVNTVKTRLTRAREQIKKIYLDNPAGKSKGKSVKEDRKGMIL